MLWPALIEIFARLQFASPGPAPAGRDGEAVVIVSDRADRLIAPAAPVPSVLVKMPLPGPSMVIVHRNVCGLHLDNSTTTDGIFPSMPRDFRLKVFRHPSRDHL